MSVLEEMQNLVKELNYHAERYYKFDSPVISDGEYDRLYDRKGNGIRFARQPHAQSRRRRIERV